MHEEKLENIVIEKEKEMKAITLSVVDMKRSVNFLETEKHLMMKTNDDLLSCWWQMTTSDGRITGNRLKHLLPVYLSFAINFERAIIRYYSKEVSELILSFRR